MLRNRARIRSTLAGLVGGLGLGMLNAALYLFFVLPMIAHDVFHTYLHYDAAVLEFTAGYVGALAVIGMAVGRFIPDDLVERVSGKRTHPLDAQAGR